MTKKGMLWILLLMISFTLTTILYSHHGPTVKLSRITTVEEDCFHYGLEILQRPFRSVMMDDAATAEECRHVCAYDTGCGWFTWHVILKLCSLHRSNNSTRANSQSVMGPQNCGQRRAPVSTRVIQSTTLLLTAAPLSYFKENRWRFAHAVHNQARYAKLHNYSRVIDLTDYLARKDLHDHSGHWNKVLSLIFWSEHAEIICWLDLDTFILQLQTPLSTFIRPPSTAWIWLPQDSDHSLAFSNFLFIVDVKRGAAARFLRSWWDTFRHRAQGWHDQASMWLALLYIMRPNCISDAAESEAQYARCALACADGPRKPDDYSCPDCFSEFVVLCVDDARLRHEKGEALSMWFLKDFAANANLARVRTSAPNLVQYFAVHMKPDVENSWFRAFLKLPRPDFQVVDIGLFRSAQGPVLIKQ